MSIIQIANLSFSYEGGSRNIFSNVSLRLDTDWKLGLIGRNGKGKTTFLRLLAGAYEYSGTIAASVAFEYFPFPIPNPEHNGLDLARSIAPDIQDWELEKELSLLDVGPENLLRPVSSLSNGERAKLMLAALFLKPNAFLLIDEPTNHLDAHGRAKVSAYLRGKRGFILVSHDRSFLDSCIDHVLSINKADIELQQGNYSSWKQNRDYQDAFEQDRQDKLKKDVKRLSEAARRAGDWSRQTEKSKYKPKDGKVPRHQQAMINRGAVGHKAAKMMKRSKCLEDRRSEALEEKESLLLNLEEKESLKIHPLRHHSRILVETTELAPWYTEGRPLFRPLSFRLEQGQRLALLGKNGSGKTSLLKMLMGAPLPHSGSLRLASGLTVSVVEQDLSFMRGSLAQFRQEHNLDENLFRAVLSRLGLSREYWNEDLRDFSDGQRKKTALARSLSQQAHLYIWDEPLNFMDVLAREQLEELLLNHEPSMIFVEHDRSFTDKVATEQLELQAP